MYKIVDESILLFSGISLSKFSLESLYISWVRVFIVGYMRNVKNHFSTKQGVLATHLRLVQVMSFSHEIIDWLNCLFCPVVL